MRDEASMPKVAVGDGRSRAGGRINSDARDLISRWHVSYTRNTQNFYNLATMVSPQFFLQFLLGMITCINIREETLTASY